MRTEPAPDDATTCPLKPDIVLRLAPLTAADLEPLGIPAIHDATGGIPRFVSSLSTDPHAPTGLAETLLRRCRAEGQSAYRLLLAASALRQPFDPESLAVLLRADAAELTEELERLCERRILMVTGFRFTPVDRVAGLLVLLYAQTPAAISRLTLEHVETTERAVRLRLGREPIALPEPLAGLVVDLLARRSGHASLGDQRTSPWLFPGGRPGQPISAYQLAERLRQLGLRPTQNRTTALFGLATELPAAVLARLLGIHIKVAVAWQQACVGDWAGYAAGYSRRTPPPAQDSEPGLSQAGERKAFGQLQ
jgi:hypothetical protein